ncbi:hypothetical protein KAS08_03485 [Candidatus Pacearchaeota archaeon]|nr:hypothetical protein [Candidatus Pacearchaeota archaeon]
MKNNDHDKADELARKLIYIDPVNEGENLKIPHLVREKFEGYLVNDENKNPMPIVMNEEYIARKAIEFVHSSLEIPFISTYMEPRFEDDFSQKSFYDCCERILREANKIGDCVGLPQVINYLLESKGIRTRAIHFKEHISLEAKINGKYVSIETTDPNGYGFISKRERLKNNDLASIVACNIGICLQNQAYKFKLENDDENASEKYIEACEILDKSLILDPENISAYKNRGFLLLQLGMNEESILDFSKAIKIGPNLDGVYFARAFAYEKIVKKNSFLPNYEKLKINKKALIDYEKYASFNENNAKEVDSKIKELKERF